MQEKDSDGKITMANTNVYADAEYADAQYEDTQYADAQYEDTQYADAQYEDAQYADAQFANNQVTINHGCPENVPSHVVSTGVRNQVKRSCKKVWRVIAIALGLTTIGLLAAIIVLVLMQNKSTPLTDSTIGSNGAHSGGSTVGSNGAPSGGSPVGSSGGHNCDNNSPAETAKSCNELRNKESFKSGVYFLRPDENLPGVEIYCDMESDGGGWSLVASIHESDIETKCYSDDLWSNYVPGQQISLTSGAVKTNWENEMTFGNVHKCVEDDYKNPAYYTLNASDVMVWHVHQGFHIDIMKTRSTFRYRTTNGFLQKYGGNLKTLFNKYFPLKIRPEDSSSKLLDALIRKSKLFKSLIPNWYNYAVGTGYRIFDSSMYYTSYKYGNQIHFTSKRQSYKVLNYGQKYRFPQSYSSVMTSSSSPFILVSTIRNEDKVDSYYELQVYSYTHYLGEVSQIQNITIGTYRLQYQAVQFIHPSYNTRCEMYFVISNPQVWKSLGEASFHRSSYSSSGYYRQTTYRIDGSPSNVLFGYILLASDIGFNATLEELDKVASVILQTISTTENVLEVPSINGTLVVPVVFDKGNTTEMMSTVPPNYRRFVEPGYLQFRAYNYPGYPNAVCPGIKVGVQSPEFVCIGGISGNVEAHGTCGDFAGWGGSSTDKMLASQPSGYAHSRNDIFSTILIFYR